MFKAADKIKKKKIRATHKKKVNNLYLNKQKEEGVTKIPITSFRI